MSTCEDGGPSSFEFTYEQNWKKKLGRLEKMWERVKVRFILVKHVCISKEIDRFKVHR
jgi:hypothetical protein